MVDLSGVEELKGIRATNDGIEIGAMTTLTEIMQHPVIRERYSLLAQAAELVASPQSETRALLAATFRRIRDAGITARVGPATAPAATSLTPTRPRAVIVSMRFCTRIERRGESFRHRAGPDRADAKFVINTHKGERVVDAEDYFIGPDIDITRLHILQPGDLLTAIRIPSMWAARNSILKKCATGTCGIFRC